MPEPTMQPARGASSSSISVEAGVAQRLVGRDHRELLEARHAARFLAVEHVARVEVVDVAGEARRVLGRVEVRRSA